jgi:hypothetical protein
MLSLVRPKRAENTHRDSDEPGHHDRTGSYEDPGKCDHSG